jgi:hypothetical protein
MRLLNSVTRMIRVLPRDDVVGTWGVSITVAGLTTAGNVEETVDA